VSRASIDQRKGRAGRTSPGTCYRLYDRHDYESRPPYTTEEIYRTDLSEVVLRMSELGILDFHSFDFISSPGREDIRSARDTLVLLQALNDDNTLSKVGEIMARFPLIPRHSRIIVEAILRYPEVMEEVLIATAFLSAQSPYILPPGNEDEAREAHRRFRERNGDFASYVTLFRTFLDERDRDRGKLPAADWCDKNFLDYRVMGEIVNIKEQLEQIVGDLGIPIIAAGDITKADKMDAYLCCIASGMIQFVCIRDGRDYRSLTADHISIHPGSVLFRENPPFMVAGEIVRTSRMYAMSVSPLTHDLLERVDPTLESKLQGLVAGAKADRGERRDRAERGKRGSGKRKGTGESRVRKEAVKRSSKGFYAVGSKRGKR
jgi:HrpA-like RNA helicase